MSSLETGMGLYPFRTPCTAMGCYCVEHTAARIREVGGCLLSDIFTRPGIRVQCIYH
jgi:hypothetical protein